jgi:hypothetical protein
MHLSSTFAAARLGLPEIVILAFLALVFGHWLWMVVQAAKEPTAGRKALWLVIVLFVPIVGQLGYWLALKSRPKAAPGESVSRA